MEEKLGRILLDCCEPIPVCRRLVIGGNCGLEVRHPRRAFKIHYRPMESKDENHPEKSASSRVLTKRKAVAL